MIARCRRCVDDDSRFVCADERDTVGRNRQNLGIGAGGYIDHVAGNGIDGGLDCASEGVPAHITTRGIIAVNLNDCS